MSTRAFPAALLSPAVARNRDPILAVLRRYLPDRGTVLEIASGTGEHAAYFAPQFPHLTWQPTDVDPDALASIEAHRAAANAPNLRAPIALDVTAPHWPVERARCGRLDQHDPHFAMGGGAGADGWRRPAACATGHILYLYGPFKENGVHTAPSNAAFDASLRARNSAWGVRDTGDVRTLAGSHGFDFIERVAMPANNLSLVFRRRAPITKTRTYPRNGQ